MILTIVVLCLVVAVIKNCHGGGYLFAPAVERKAVDH